MLLPEALTETVIHNMFMVYIIAQSSKKVNSNPHKTVSPPAKFSLIPLCSLYKKAKMIPAF